MHSRSLEGKRVAVTRAPEDSIVLRLLLEARGASILEVAVIAVAPLEDLTALDHALENLDSYAWITFASRNAAAIVLDRLGTRRVPDQTRIAAVGQSTARRLEEAGVRPDCVPLEANAAGLVDALEAIGVAGQRILIPAGDQSRRELRDGLERAGAIVDEIVAYRTGLPEPPPDLGAFRRREVDAVLLASPSALRNLETLLGDRCLLDGVALVCIGLTTAAAVRQAGYEPAAVAREQTVDGLVTALEDLYGTE